MTKKEKVNGNGLQVQKPEHYFGMETLMGGLHQIQMEILITLIGITMSQIILVITKITLTLQLMVLELMVLGTIYQIILLVYHQNIKLKAI